MPKKLSKKAIAAREAERRRINRTDEREAVWKALWEDPKYLKLQATMEEAGRAWNRADAFKREPGGSLEKAASELKRFDAAIAAKLAHEKAAFERAGLPF